MDQQTMIIIGVVAAIAILGFFFLMLLGGAFMWFASKRRANPRVRDVPGSKKNGTGNCQSRGRVECDPLPVEQCVPARVPVEDDRPVAIYGVAQGECCGDGRLSQKQVQRFVDLDNEIRDQQADEEFISRAESVFSRFRSSQGGARQDDPIQDDPLQ